MAFKNALRQHRSIIYRLERNYGIDVLFYRLTSESTDVKTGNTAIQWTAKLIHKCVVMEESQQRKFAYDLAYVAANKNFTYGAFFDPRKRLVFARVKYFPIPPTMKDHFEFSGKRYEIVDIQLVENIECYSFNVRALDTYESGNL